MPARNTDVLGHINTWSSPSKDKLGMSSSNSKSLDFFRKANQAVSQTL